jgi:hypothetical protein
MSDLLGDTSAAIYTVLSGGTALVAQLATVPGVAGTASLPAIYDMQAPDGAPLPYVIFQHQGGGPDNITSAGIESNVWAVKIHTASGAKNASQIFALVDELLHRKNLSISGGTVNTWWCCREENVKLLENLPNGKRIWMRGGIYRIRTSK